MANSIHKLKYCGWLFLFLILATSCQKDEDLMNKFEFKVYGEGYEWVGYMDSEGWHGGHYRGSGIFKFEVPKGDSMGIYNSGNHSILIVNDDVYIDIYHSEPLQRIMIFE